MQGHVLSPSPAFDSFFTALSHNPYANLLSFIFMGLCFMLKCFSFNTTGWGSQSLTTEHGHLRSAIINVTFALQTRQDQPYSHLRAAAFCLHPIGLSFLCNSPLACIPVPNHSTSSLIGLMGLGTKGFKAVWKCCSAIFVFLFKKNPKLLKQDHIAVIVFSNLNIILL